MSKFDEAVQVSLNAGQEFLDSLNDLQSLLAELSDAVQKATADAVVVEAMTRGGKTVGGKLKEFLSGSALGSEPEDRSRTVVVVAKGKSGEVRTLWEVEYSPDGYPITVIAPDGSEMMCVTREDLEQTFIELLQQGATGRKIKMLQEKSTKQAS
jgi:hypothetical protein